jgi:hypothetical protein
MDDRYFRELIAIAATGMIIGGIIFSYVAYGQDRSSKTILECFHNGEVKSSVPDVLDFQLKQTGMFIEVRWTNPDTREREVLVTTLPCLYRVTNPPEDVRPAD